MPAHALNQLGQSIGTPVNDWRGCEHPGRDTMQGNHCRLEALCPERHAEELFAANAMDSEGRMWTYLPYGPFDDYASYLDWIKPISSSAIKDPIFYAIIDARTNEALGLSAFQRIDPANGSIEVGHIAYSPRLQQTTAATEAMYLMMDRAFSLGYRRCEWKCNSLNVASSAAAQRLGFSFEGIFRQAAIVKGCNRDTAWYSVVDREWPALKMAFMRWLDAGNFNESGKQRLSLSALTKPLLLSRG